MPPKLAAIFSRTREDTPLAISLGTPTTRKHQYNYHDLYNYGLEGSPRASSSQAEPASKRSRPNRPRNPSPQESTEVIPNDEPAPPPSPTPLPNQKEKKKEAIQKYAWWWKYFDVKELEKTFLKGKKGHRQEEVHDELYTCNVRKDCPFFRYASKLHTCVTALKDHIVDTHKVKEDTDETLARISNPTAL